MTIRANGAEDPNCDVILMFKILILQQWYGLSDLEVERQMDAMGLQVKRGTVQDATFIEADPGSSKKLRGENAKTRRSRDGT